MDAIPRRTSEVISGATADGISRRTYNVIPVGTPNEIYGGTPGGILIVDAIPGDIPYDMPGGAT